MARKPLPSGVPVTRTNSTMRGDLSVQYVFYSPLVRQVMDNQGIVHETFEVPQPSGKTYRRATWCSRTDWHLVEPVNTCGANTVTNCLSCLGEMTRGAP